MAPDELLAYLDTYLRHTHYRILSGGRSDKLLYLRCASFAPIFPTVMTIAWHVQVPSPLGPVCRYFTCSNHLLCEQALWSPEQCFQEPLSGRYVPQ